MALLTWAPSALAKDKTEDQLIQELSSPDAGKVTDALLQLEKKFPTSTKAFPTIKGLLHDPRPKVQRKAARVLGALHADVSSEDVKAICGLLKAGDVETITDGLKALRGLRAPEAIPEITPFLNHSNTHLVRDACRTLAALGKQDLIPSIEPLLNHAEPAVRKDAQDAIATLRSKS